MVVTNYYVSSGRKTLCLSEEVAYGMVVTNCYVSCERKGAVRARKRSYGNVMSIY